MVNYILPLVGLIFFSIAVFHITSVLRAVSKPDRGASIYKKVRIKLAAIFFLAGMALIGFYAFIR